MVKVFQHWGLEVSLLYQEQFEVKGRFQKLMASLQFGKEVVALFSKARVDIPSCDFLVLDNLRYFHWDLHFLDESKKPTIIYNAHNLEFENFFGKIPGPNRDKFSEYEARIVDRSDLILVCSTREKEILQKLNPDLNNKVFVFPNLVDADQYKISSDKKWITFLGSLDYFPNIQAIEFIGSDFIKYLPANLRDKIVIAGRNPTEKVKRICKEQNLQLRENLSDDEITELLATTKVSLVPLVSGSGTRLKIIESLFSHAMVLSTEMGAEGVEHGGLAIAELDDFSQECIRLYNTMDNFSSLCPDSLYLKYLESYDCHAWAAIHRDKFKEILTI